MRADKSGAELSHAYKNLERCGYKLDYILTHKYTKVAPRPHESPELEELLSFINERVEFSHWYSGHSHTNEKIDDKHTRVYDELLALRD